MNLVDISKPNQFEMLLMSNSLYVYYGSSIPPLSKSLTASGLVI